MAGLVVEPRFVVDVNVGRLARWLRVLGYDALFLPNADDGELLRTAREQDRTIVTRDRYILQRRAVARGEVKAVLVASDRFRDQMRELTQALGLDLRNAFSRCLDCNEPLQAVSKGLVDGKVPSFVFSSQEHFLQCPSCGKLYWRGTHWRNMWSELAAFTQGD